MGNIDIALSVLKYAKPDLRLDIKNSFDDRLRLQKYVFIMEKLGLNLGYDFNEYLRGPYSPGLAMDYYGNADTVKELKISRELTNEERKVAEKMKEIVELTPTELEALSYVLLKGWLCDDDALVNVGFYKPHLTVNEVERAIGVGRRVLGCK
ncbi:hypothetical protein HS7_21400 [Sulfolobales archaeon HS-7]|nr:hypothetical protein HS7_21400 [Sulfolobales archaeon HS-7]